VSYSSEPVKGTASVDVFIVGGIATLDRLAGMKLRGGLSIGNGIVYSGLPVVQIF